MVRKIICPSANPNKHVVILSYVKEAVVSKLFATTSDADKYISIDKGLKSVNEPKINTKTIVGVRCCFNIFIWANGAK